MTKWSDQIEEDLKWREAELGSIKLATASAPEKSDRQRALLRALWTMLYAHYEGFCKFCWELLLNEIEREKCTRSHTIECIALLSLTKVFQDLRRDISPTGIWSFVHEKLPNEMSQSAVFPVRLETRSNLWPKLACENNLAIGLPITQIELNAAQLNALVGRRNEIAHGKKLVVESLEEYSNYENAVMVVLHELAVAVVDCLDQKKYMSVPPVAP